MDEHGNSDHLSSSLTDLMTSLMVIFILLLLVFVSRTASRDPDTVAALLAALKKDLIPEGHQEFSIRPDPTDRNAILVIVPGKSMQFEIQRSALQDQGRKFIKQYIPDFARVLCSDRFRTSIDSIVVEGHTDHNQWANSTAEESQDKNLKLSQERSMAVVEEALLDLRGQDVQRTCFVEKLSATGRGEQDPEQTNEASRRVIFRIRVRTRDLQELTKRIVQ